MIVRAIRVNSTVATEMRRRTGALRRLATRYAAFNDTVALKRECREVAREFDSGAIVGALAEWRRSR